MATIFTKIIQGEIPCYKVAENENNFAFLDINPLTEGHTLVVPKREVDNLFDLPEEEYKELLDFARTIAKKMQDNLDCVRVGVTVLGFEIPHAHIHLVPMNKESDMLFSNPKLKLTQEEFNTILNKIKLY
ncbi:MAG: HIT family protein [Rikenellaceae bacterium]